MAWWFFERVKKHGSRPESNQDADSPVDKRHFGLHRKARELMLCRWLEECIGRLVAPIGEANAMDLGTERARESGAMWAGPAKEAAVAKWMLCFGVRAAQRLVTEGRRHEAAGLLPEDLADTAVPSQGDLPPLLDASISVEKFEGAIRERALVELGGEDLRRVDAWIVRAVRGRGFDRPR